MQTQTTVTCNGGNPPGRYVSMPIMKRPANGGFISTLEGHNLYAKYGPNSPEYQAAKGKWLSKQQGGKKQNMNGLQVFQNEQFGELRVIMRGEDHWFVAADVCRALEIDRTQTRRLDEDEKGVRSIHTPSGDQEMTIVSEPGLYSLVLGSRKPEAKAFKRWITHEVIPSIRKHGMYATSQTIEAMLSDPDTMIKTLQALKAEREQRIAAEQKVAELVPKGAFFDTVTGSRSAMPFDLSAKILGYRGIGRNNLFAFLREKNVLRGNNQPYQEFIDRGYFRVIESKYTKPNGDTEVSYKTLIHQKGLDYVRRLLDAAGYSKIGVAQ